MSMIPFLALAVAQQTYYNTQRALQNSINSSRNYSSRRSYNSSSSYSKPRIPDKMSKILENAKDRRKDYVSYFDLLVVRAIHSDEKAKTAILNLTENYARIHSANLAAINSKILTYSTPAQTHINKVELLKEQVEKLGFKVESETMYDTSYPTGKKEDGKIVYSKPKLPYRFNGVKLTAEIINSGINPYEEKLKEFEKENPDVENKYNEAVKKHDRLAKRKLLLKLSANQRYKLSDLNYNANNLKSLCERKQEYIEHAKHYASLDDKQKQVLLSLFAACDKVKEVGKKVNRLTSTHALLSGYTTCDNKKQKRYAFYLESLLTKSSECLSEGDKQALISFEERAAEKIISLSDDKAKQILSTFSGREISLDIDGEKIPNEILYELSDSCLEFIDSMTKVGENEIEVKNDMTK